MKHNLHGDLQEEHQKLAEELLELEEYFNTHNDIVPEVAAKAYTCLAHDWYTMGDDDKGSDMLIKADKACPGYFDNQMQIHVTKDPEYSILVQSLASCIFNIAKSVLEQKKC